MTSVEITLSQMLSAANDFKKATTISGRQKEWNLYVDLFDKLKPEEMTEAQKKLLGKYEFIISRTFRAADEAFEEILKKSEGV